MNKSRHTICVQNGSRNTLEILDKKCSGSGTPYRINTRTTKIESKK